MISQHPEVKICLILGLTIIFVQAQIFRYSYLNIYEGSVINHRSYSSSIVSSIRVKLFICCPLEVS